MPARTISANTTYHQYHFSLRINQAKENTQTDINPLKLRRERESERERGHREKHYTNYSVGGESKKIWLFCSLPGTARSSFWERLAGSKIRSLKLKKVR
jgi:hypothetical protein